MAHTDPYMSLTQFLKSNVVDDKNTICTVTGMGGMRGKWSVSNADYPKFLDLLNEYLFESKQRPLNIVEQRKSDGYAPLMVDLDFKYKPESAIQRQFQIKHVHLFVEKYIEIIKTFFDLYTFSSNTPSNTIRFFITLRPTPYEDKKSGGVKNLKDGIHIMSPDLVLHSEYQQIFRHIALERNIVYESFKDVEFVNTHHDIFDESVTKKQGWFFYGESKPDIPAYELKSIYTYDTKSKIFYEEENSFTNRQLLELLSIRYNIRETELTPIEDSMQEWVRLYNAVIRKRIESSAENAQNHSNDRSFISVTEYTESEIELAKKLTLNCFTQARADNYNTWMEVGWCLHNIEQSESMFQCWMNFSEKSPKFSSNNTEKLRMDWNSNWGKDSHEHPLTMRSIHFWAKEDNPEQYKKIIDEDIIHYIEKNVDATHTHISRLLFWLYINTFRADMSQKHVDWFMFESGIWRKSLQGIDLRNKIINEVDLYVSKARELSREKMIRDSGGADVSFYGRTPKKLEGVINSVHKTNFERLLNISKCLYNSGFKDSVMKESVGLFYEKNISKKFNSNPYTIGFVNGVLDLRSKFINTEGKEDFRVEFREGKPTDYLTFIAGKIDERCFEPYQYIHYNPRDPEQREIEDFMKKIFPDNELRLFIWRKLASCLEGSNKEQVYDTWIGKGGNGKSKLVELMAMTFGDYASSLQSTALTRKRPESGAANPDIMAIRNKRFIYMSEPDDREPLNTSRMKQITGEDVIEARGLYEDQTRFQITGKLFMLCNALPIINTMDWGTWRRIQVIPFVSSFVNKDSPELNPDKHVYEKDINLDLKLRRWRPYFMAKLAHVYEHVYMKYGIGEIPQIVKMETRKYQDMYDSFGKFTNARVRDEGGCMSTLNEVIKVYRDWTQMMGYMGGKRLSVPELEKRLDNTFGNSFGSNKTYRRLRLFHSDEEIEEYDSEIHKQDIEKRAKEEKNTDRILEF